MVKLPPRSANLNAFAERFVGLIKTECLDRMMFFSTSQLRYTIQQYMANYHEDRNLQGRKNQLIEGSDGRIGGPRIDFGGIEQRRRLGGLLNFYRRVAVNPFICSLVVEQRQQIGESLNSYRQNAARVGPIVFLDGTGARAC
jgi:transposase InsO family protein